MQCDRPEALGLYRAVRLHSNYMYCFIYESDRRQHQCQTRNLNASDISPEKQLSLFVVVFYYRLTVLDY